MISVWSIWFFGIGHAGELRGVEHAHKSRRRADANHKPSSNLPALEPTTAMAERCHRQDATIDSGRMQGPLFYQFQQPGTKNDCPHLQVRAVSSLYRINHAPLLPLPLGILRDPPCGSPRRSNPSTAALAPPRKLSLLLLLLLLLPLVSHLRLRLPALPRVL